MHWIYRAAVGGMMAGMLMLSVGCEDTKQLKADKDDLSRANLSLRDRLTTLQNENQTLLNQNRNLVAQVQAKDAQIAELVKVQRPVAPPSQPAPPKPFMPSMPPGPVGPIRSGGGEDFEGDVTRSRGKVTVNLESDVLFAPGKATLNSSANAALDKIAKVLKSKYANHKVKVVGHTDSDPIKRSNWKSNQELSQARAKAVGDYLVKQGVPAGDVEMTGVADTDPRVSPEKTAADKAKNRRVEIQVVLNAGE